MHPTVPSTDPGARRCRAAPARRRRVLPVAAVALTVVGAGCGGDRASESVLPAPDGGPVVVYRGGQVWTGTGFEARDLAVQDGRFVEPARSDSMVDLSGLFLVPPFGDAHSHTFGTEYSPYYLTPFVEDGIFYGLDLTNPASGGIPMQARTASDSTMDLAFSHGGLSRRAGPSPHPAGVMERLYGEEGSERWSLEGDAYWTLEAPAEVDSIWPAFLAQDPDVVKVYIMASGRGREGCGYGLCPEVVRRVVERAGESGLRVFAHVGTARDVEVALETGVDALAHLPLGNDGITAEEADRFVLDSATIAEIGAREMVMTPTSHLLLGEVESFPSDTLEQEIALQRQQLRALHDAGARLALSGHDWRVTSRREAEYLVRYGIFDAETVLRLWAEVTPQAIWPDRRIGRLEPGFEGSFLALGDDPTQDFSATERIRLRIKEGHEMVVDEGGGG